MVISYLTEYPSTTYVLERIEPELYHIVLFRKPLLPMLQLKPAEFLRQHVHHVAISVELEHTDVVQILSTCTGVHDLAIWNNAATRPDLLPLLCKLTNLQRLSANFFALFGGDDDFTWGQFRIPPLEGLPSFAYLTHLDFFGLILEEFWPFLGMLPRLTHLALTDDTETYSPELVNAALGTCPVLQLLVVLWTSYGPLPDDSEISTDPRFCIVEYSLNPYEFDWELGARGGRDVWRRAEEAVAHKTRERQKGLTLRPSSPHFFKLKS